MLLGDHCYFDIRTLDSGEPDWGRNCCPNKAVPVKTPPDDISGKQIKQVGAELGQAQLKLGLNFTLIFSISFCLFNFHWTGQLELSMSILLFINIIASHGICGRLAGS